LTKYLIVKFLELAALLDLKMDPLAPERIDDEGANREHRAFHWLFHSGVNIDEPATRVLARTHTHVTSLPNVSRDIWQEISTGFFCTSLAPFFALWILFPESVSPDSKRQSSAGPYGLPVSPPLPAFYFTALCANCRRIGSSIARVACVLRASGRRIIIVSCLTQPRPHVMWSLSILSLSLSLSLGGRPRKAQIAKNNIALDGEQENNRIAGGAGGGR